MSDFFKKMKSIFVVDADQPAPQEGIDKTVSTPKTTQVVDAAQQVTTQEYTEDNQHPVSDQFYKILFDAMEKNNQSGYDYLEFRKTLQALTSLNHDEQTRFLSAFAGAQASGIDAARLVQSANAYIDVLNKEADSFNSAVEDQRSKQITNKQDEIKQLEGQIENKNNQIQKLQSEIASHTSLLQNLNTEISKSQQKIDATKANFHAAFQSLVNNIKGDIDRIKTYIK